MRSQAHGTAATHPLRSRETVRRAAFAVMLLAGAGLIAAILVGAPLVSILLVGLLLLCPLLLWMPFRFERRALEELDPAREDAGRTSAHPDEGARR